MRITVKIWNKNVKWDEMNCQDIDIGSQIFKFEGITAMYDVHVKCYIFPRNY